MNKYIEFVETGDTGKTKIFEVRSKSGGAMLAMIKWYGPWRQYVMFPVPNTVWNTDCLDSIAGFIRQLMVARAVASGDRTPVEGG